MQRIPVASFLALSEAVPVLDVRSPGEYAHAHIPGAVSFPLFSDEERARVGTAYKQQSREDAIKIGLDAFGPNMRAMVERAEAITAGEEKRVALHCWRGGMRSEAVAWLLDLYGFEVHVLDGGYKAYRQWVISHWEERNLRLLCGNTGSGKTAVLHALRYKGAPVLDLEGLAGHKGSAFGGLDRLPQPTQEMFENRLGHALEELRNQFGDTPVWVEDESQRIGDINLPHQFFKAWPQAQRVFLEVPFEERLHRIVQEYGRHSTESLVNAMIRIRKRLGPLETKTAINHLIEGDLQECFRILLKYYDKQYRSFAVDPASLFNGAGRDANEIASILLDYYP